MIASSSVSRLRASLVALVLICVVQASDMVFAWSGLNPAWWSIALLASALAVVLAGTRLTQRLARISAVLTRSAQGDLSARIVGLRESGVLSDLIHRINHVLDLTDAFIREAEASILFVSRGRYFRRILTDGIPGDFTTRARAINAASEAMGAKLSGFGELTKGFEIEVGDVVQSVAGAAAGLTAAADRVGAASVTTTRNVQDAASAATQLGKAIEEIGQEVRHSTAIARRAVEEAGRTDRVVRELTDAAGRIAQVVDLIQDVAEQTNLLALNATIEAARAGEAGKGFAVVAGEVKALANQTAKATDEIRSQIQKMTDASRDAVEAVRVIHGTIGKIDDISSTIATAVEKQDAATREIATWVNDAAMSVQGIATEIGGGSDHTAGRFSVSTAANDLSVQAATLRQSVGSYLGAVKAATGTSAARTG